MKRIGIRLASIGFVVAASAASIVATSGATTTAHFTADQVSRGRLSYIQQCSICHGGDLGGFSAPALAGPNSNIQWLTPGDVWGYMTVYMPPSNAGALSQSQYLDIMAFLMQQNGRHADGTSLVVQAIQRDPLTMSPER